MSIESRHGWHDLRLAMEAWPERILEARAQGKSERDELDFFLCFFTQCWSLVDWAKESGAIAEKELQLALRGRQSMMLCRDISNRYKHLILKQKPTLDRDWSIWSDHDVSPPIYCVTALDKTWSLWELMCDCIAFWEEAAAAYSLGEQGNVFRPS